jgi:hypothetical protein
MIVGMLHGLNGVGLCSSEILQRGDGRMIVGVDGVIPRYLKGIHVCSLPMTVVIKCRTDLCESFCR